MELKGNAMFSRVNVIKKVDCDLTKTGKSNNVWTYPVLSDSHQADLTKPGKSINVWTYPILSDPSVNISGLTRWCMTQKCKIR